MVKGKTRGCTVRRVNQQWLFEYQKLGRADVESNPHHQTWKAEVIAIIRCPPALLIMTTRENGGGEGFNLRRQSRQIYSLIPLAAQEPLITKCHKTSSFAPAFCRFLWEIKQTSKRRQQRILILELNHFTAKCANQEKTLLLLPTGPRTCDPYPWCMVALNKKHVMTP